ncbi:amidase [Streptomyces canus]|uniref:amidase n=1 Tax=Streptomyces canus TaxID=58343 RepID=UPI003723FAAF
MASDLQNDLCFTPATELAAMIKKRELSPVELVEAVLARAERVEPTVNAYVTLLADEARAAAARAADQVVNTAGDELGALHGIPLAIKDLTPTKGIRTTFGSVQFKDHVPQEDALIVTRARAAGAILLGKTTTAEFGMHSVTETELTGITRNPWNPERTVGGSSGGSAAAVAAGIGPLATGSDGGGSIRVPAAMCGVVGLKASPGRIPHSVEFNAYETSAVVGPITRTVADNALLLSVLAGYDPHQPFSIPDKPDFPAAVLGASVAGLRVAYSPDLGAGPVEPEVARAVEEAVRAFEELGASVEPVDIALPDPVEYFLRYWGSLSRMEFEHVGASVDDAGPLMADFVRATEKFTATDFARTAFVTRAEIRRAFATVFDTYDLMIWPTTKMAAYPHVGDRGGPAEVAGVSVHGRHGLSDLTVRALQNQLFTEAVSHAGYPALTVPAGFTAEGLPVGLQIASRQYDDVAVLRAGAAFEAARPWADKRPSL